jgi:hypothetical protein
MFKHIVLEQQSKHCVLVHPVATVETPSKVIDVPVTPETIV